MTSANSSISLLYQDTIENLLQTTATATDTSNTDAKKRRILREGDDDNTTKRYDWLLDIIHDHFDGLTSRWKSLDDYAAYKVPIGTGAKLETVLRRKCPLQQL
jgi:hypothetical protein